MKALSLIAVLLIANLAHAKTFHCTATDKSIKDDGMEGIFDVAVSEKALHLVGKVNNKNYDLKIDRDEHDSLNDKDASNDNFYNLDEDYNKTKEARYVTSDDNLAGSDADSIVFVEKQMLQAKPGSITLSGGQANDGESGDPWIWGRSGEYSCK